MWIQDVFIESINAQFAQRVHLAPNPAAGKTLLTFPNEIGEAFSLRMYDATGRIVRTYDSLRSNSLEILRGDLPAGVYAIELTGAAAHWSGRVVWE